MRLASTPPSYCSSCHGFYADRKYIDFDAYWDGPTLNGENNIKIAIDDLIICEECLGAAAGLIGWVNKKEMRKENFELGRAVDVKDKEIKNLTKIVSDLEHTLRLALDGKVRRGEGKPSIRVEGLGEVA